MLRYVVVVVFLFCSGVLQAEGAITERVSESVDVGLYFGTGMIAFHDLYLPLTNADPFVPHLRADGNTREANSYGHFGLAVECGLALRYHEENYQLGYHLAYRRAGSLGVGGIHADSSYANISTGVKFFYNVNTHTVLPGLGLAVQRVGFSNLSTSHTVLSLLPTAELQLPLTAKFSVGGHVGYALWDRLGYATDTQFMGAALPHAHVRTWTAGLTARKDINSDTGVVFVVHHENIKLHLDDINVYKQFGLTLYAEEFTPQDTVLQTNTFSVSLQRDF